MCSKKGEISKEYTYNSRVRGFIDGNGTAQLNLEDVSRGLGFVRSVASGNEVVRWERVRGHLRDFGVPISGYDGDVGKEGLPEFIAENGSNPLDSRRRFCLCPNGIQTSRGRT
ncbi:hypothetical protein [Paenibacillus sp. Aloe-11]|uniref:hypothetical protein n=1 Tax=Paenibacillus sp. Aloe-11 TaxID=1050222 RepID=UPI001E45BAD8|nr:hypothetical protein [Paenibacillus sp. Aloe-11]